MLPTTIRAAPAVDDFILLSDYQSTTPQSFHDGKAVLHYHAVGARAWLPKDQQTSMPVFPVDAPAFDGDSGEMISQDEIVLFINSENLTIFNTNIGAGIQLPYPSIALHAMQHKVELAPDAAADSHPNKLPCVLLQLDLSDGGDDDETFDTIQLTLIPPESSTDLSFPAQNGRPEKSEQERLFDAITACQNLHPDPADPDEDDHEDYSDRIVFEPAMDGPSEGIEGLPGVFRGNSTGGLPPPMSGSTTGWITAENMGDFFDVDGNWIGGGDGNGEAEALGEGAGRVRARHELNGLGNEDGEGEEAKRTRTE